MPLSKRALVRSDCGMRVAACGERHTKHVVRPGHIRPEAVAAEALVRPMPGAASPNGNSVSLEAEMVKAVDVKQQHDMALSIYRSVSEIIRASLGRR